MVEKSNQFDEWLAICQNFPYQYYSLNVLPVKPIINSPKFCSPKFHLYKSIDTAGIKSC